GGAVGGGGSAGTAGSVAGRTSGALLAWADAGAGAGATVAAVAATEGSGWQPSPRRGSPSRARGVRSIMDRLIAWAAAPRRTPRSPDRQSAATHAPAGRAPRGRTTPPGRRPRSRRRRRTGRAPPRWWWRHSRCDRSARHGPARPARAGPPR